MSNRIVHLFKNTDMRNQHDGLAVLARKHRVHLEKLKPGEHVVFLNASCSKVKLYSANGVLSYWRNAGRGALNLNAIEMIPKCFNAAGGVDWEKADRLAIEKLLGKAGLEETVGAT